MTKAFPIKNLEDILETTLDYFDIMKVSQSFSFHFQNAGYMKDGHIYTCKIEEDTIPCIPLGKILEENVEETYS